MRLRIGTFNLENWDDEDRTFPLSERVQATRPMMLRMEADVLCLQEVHAQEPGGSGDRVLSALDALIAGTPYADFHRVATETTGGELYDVRNLVVLSRFPIEESDLVRDGGAKPTWKLLTADPPAEDAREIGWERPIQHCQLRLPSGDPLHVINLHLKSKLPSAVSGQQFPDQRWKWRSAAGWAEGYFMSSMKRVGQAMQTRRLLDGLFAMDRNARIAVCGDLNADLEDVPVLAIRGRVEETQNPDLGYAVIHPCERTVPESSRFSHYHHGVGNMLDHVLVSRGLLDGYRGTEIHNEFLHDESVAFADRLYPEPDHAPVVAEFEI